MLGRWVTHKNTTEFTQIAKGMVKNVTYLVISVKVIVLMKTVCN